MGRSKFPGKPPKTVTRKRIKVLGRPEANNQNDSVTVAENIYYGLSLFNHHFGPNEKKCSLLQEHPPFHGFSSNEAKLSVSYVKTQQRDGNAVEKSAPTSTEAIVESGDGNVGVQASSTGADTSEESSEKKNIDDETSKRSSEDDKSVVVEEPTSNNIDENLENRDKFDDASKGPLKSVNNIMDRHQRTRQLRNSTAKRLLQRAKTGNAGNASRNAASMQCGDKSNGNVRKFVLPVRSAHSSRVIKPNKRFIEELEESIYSEHCENEAAKNSKKAKYVSGRNEKTETSSSARNATSPERTDEKETRRSKKSVVGSANEIHECISTIDGTSSTAEAQRSRETRNDGKKVANKSGNRNTCGSSTLLGHDNVDISSATSGSGGKNVAEVSRLGEKKFVVPTKVLPDLNVPNVESSRVQTRSGTQSETSGDASLPAKPEVPRETDESREKGEDAETTVGRSFCKTVVADEETEVGRVERTGTKCSDDSESESAQSESTSEHDDHSEDEQSEWSGMKLNGGKVILRKARLKLDNKTLGGTEGPFSTSNSHVGSTGNSNPGPTATVKCGVCGAVRFYRFSKQARKFGIHSCESCRKFISKMIKRQACAKSSNTTLPILQCHKGDGMCLVPPVVRSQQWNLMRCVYKARCPACWLKMCLKCYNVPSALRTGLNGLLPPLMRDSVVSVGLVQDDVDGVCQNKSSGPTKLSWPAEDCVEKNLFKSAMSWSNVEISRKMSYHGNAGGLLSKKLEKFDYPISMSPGKKRKNDNRIKVRKKLKNPLSMSTASHCPSTPRQRIDLKGPRVKHVCRSASVALGQPLATFPSGDGKDADVEATTKIPPKTLQSDEKTDKKIETPKDKENNSQKSNQESSCTSSSNSTNGSQTSCAKRNKSQTNVLAPNRQVVRSLPKPRIDAIHTISIDFWEQYDPAEVGTKGFALISSELFHIPAVCFLCGSGGKEPLIHCQCCCEPYHAFCLEPSEWNACSMPNWCCPRCTICQTCRLRSGSKLSCVRCRQSFHHSCLSKSGVSGRLYSPDRPYVCQSCVKCKSCGSEGVNVHVGNLPLCSMCFKLRQRGNYCPLCQRFYNENDCDTKMMECNECSCWVHARCEGLSDESYQIMSYLPDSIEFTCSQCSPRPNSLWRSAIDTELRTGFASVIKSLSKNRKTRAALKWTPQKECSCKPSANSRRLEFVDLENSPNNEEIEDPTSEKSSETSSNSTNVDSKSDNSSKTRNNVDSTNEKRVDVPRRGLRRMRQKFRFKECAMRVKNRKIPPNVRETNGSEYLTDGRDCQCTEQQIIARPSACLASLKRKVNGNEYISLSEFYRDVEKIVDRANSADLFRAYKNCLREIFPWFDPESVKITIDASTNDDTKARNIFSAASNDEISETTKEETAKPPKIVAMKNQNFYGNVCSEDGRTCCLCKASGDGHEAKEGRLLYCGHNEWIHANCALWSNEVFEEIDGSLQNVHRAISRGRSIRCGECGKKGATVVCSTKNCEKAFHYPCARNVAIIFNNDKTIFCPSHATNCSMKNTQTDFDVRRSVYVELDRKKKKYAEPERVKIMIGSLTVDCLGSVVPEFSDTNEKILPANYKCSRLYWSTVNPLKIVRYHIRTYVQMYVPESRQDDENNVTIDHSKEREKEAALADRQNIERSSIKQTLEALVDSVCNREVDENLAEQNNTDLLPPEIKDAIFEDLPHDLLDGISMQDIFPKMTYEDFLAMDLKTDGVFGPDLLKDEILTAEVDEIMKPPDSKISRLEVQSATENVGQNDFWLHLGAKGSVHDRMDDIYNAKSQKIGGRELKRSKSEVMTNNPLTVGGQRHHQRSCSLTWSCKLDGTYGPTMKRRKIPRPSTTPRSAEANVMLVDSQNVERNSLFHELRIPESIMVTVGRANTPSILSESVRELKYCMDDSTGLNRLVIPPRDETKDHKRLLWQHARQQPRILQVDGPADPSSASECSSPEYNMEERVIPPRTASNIPQVDGTNDDSSCDDEWFVYKNRQKSSATANYFDDVLQRSVVSPTSEKLENTSVDDQNSNDGLRIPQLDGADDISSDEECSSPRTIENDGPPTDCVAVYEINERPVTCQRCKCTYRTRDSYDRHLSNCDLVTTSDSDSETMDNKGTSPISRFSPSMDSMSPEFATMSPSEGRTMTSDYPDVQVSSPLEASVASPHPAVQIEPMAQALITPQMHSTVETVHRTLLTSNDVIVQTQYTRTTTTLPTPATVLPQESTVEITEISDSPSSSVPARSPIINETSINQESTNLPLSPHSNATSNPASKNSIPMTPNYSSTIGHNSTSENPPTANFASSRIVKPKSPRAPRSRAKSIKPNAVRTPMAQQNGNQMRYQPMQTATPVLQLQQQQRTAGPTMILQQVPNPGIMSAYVETLQQQSGQNVQYITTLGGQQESSYKPQFIATNQLVPGAYIQTGSENLLALQNGGISVLPSVQIAQPQQTVLGTIIQQQPNSIQCGVISSEQLVLSSTPTLEMFSDSTGSMFVSSQPMYYGLETIVSNTVMSSSQFMTGAVPQVLASSYQTTTQVFQASKLMDPMVDVQTVASMPNVPAVQAVQTVPGGYVVVNQTPTANEAIARAQQPTHRVHPPVPVPSHPAPPAPPPPPPPLPAHVAHPQDNFVARNGDTMKEQCQFHVQPTSRILPPDIRPPVINSYVDPVMRIVSPPKPTQQTPSTIPRVAVRPSPASHTVTQMNHSPWKTPEPIYNNEHPIDNNTRPYFDSKHVSKNTSMIKSTISAQLPSIGHHCSAPRNNVVNDKLIRDVDNCHNGYGNVIDVANCNNVVNNNVSNNVCTAVVQNSGVQSKLTMPTTNAAPLCRPMNRVLPMQAVAPKPEPIKPLEKPEIVIEEPTKPIIERPTTEEIEKIVKIPIVREIVNVAKDMPDLNDTVSVPEPEIVKINDRPVVETTKLHRKIVETTKEKIDVETPLKIVLQKQLEDGSYKITHNETVKSSLMKKNTGSPTIVDEKIKQTPQITSLQLLPIKTFTLKANKADDKSANLPKPRPTPIAVKKPRFVAKPPTSSSNVRKTDAAMEKPSKPIVTGPSLMYEIKSQDGFTHTASSMAEVWDTVFQAVQNARKAHNLPPLAHNPLTEGLGLENNATVYLVEQLAGVNRCTKYKPKFHNLKPPKTRDADNDSFNGCVNGAARAEAFRGRKVHDMFSWLASRHRQQPKMIAISETELRRAASTNLPMAMRFRVLKETSKESVGVYHSHIHGRGLFCLRDIEAGEMVIEYAGEVIRASLTDKREKYYDSKNIGCYMFKIDDHLVVDATMKGNAARFINHSCEPNCYSRVVDILGKKHILIFALRRIVQGEELTYDYKFPFEDIKIPCTCGSRRCRKYLN